MVSPAIILLGQLIVSLVIMLVVRPPFVCVEGRLKVSTALFIAVAVTVACGCAFGQNTSSIVQSTFEMVRKGSD